MVLGTKCFNITYIKNLHVIFTGITALADGWYIKNARKSFPGTRGQGGQGKMSFWEICLLNAKNPLGNIFVNSTCSIFELYFCVSREERFAFL